MKRYIIYKFVAVVLSAIIYASCGDDKYPADVVASTSPFVCFEVSVQNEVYKEGSEANIYVPSSASTLNINVRSIYSWGTSLGYKSWVSVSPNQGSGNSTFTLNIEENPSSQVRSEKVGVHCNGQSLYIQIHQAAKGDETFSVHGVSFIMIEVQGGTFQMGATSEQQDPDYREFPVHNVTLSSYYIGETEVTQALWKAVMGSNPSYYTSSVQLPVENVSWNDCQDFIKELNRLTGKNFRLPTEAEWEYAARGGSKSQGYQYSGSNTIGYVAWYDGNSNDMTHPVKQKQANELGIYDMSGNVIEWCQDWYGGYSSSSQINPTGPVNGSYRVNRGGHFNSESFCRVSSRSKISPSARFGHQGFRLAL